MNLQIRPALSKDAEVLSHIAFTAKSYWGYPKHWMEIWKPQFTFSPEYFEEVDGWIAEVDGVPVAFYTLEERTDKAWIENLWVLPEYIGQGIGKRLFLHAISRSRLKGHLTLQLEADPNAVGFYEKMEMHKVGESRFEIEGQPRILPIMEIQL